MSVVLPPDLPADLPAEQVRALLPVMICRCEPDGSVVGIRVSWPADAEAPVVRVESVGPFSVR